MLIRINQLDRVGRFTAWAGQRPDELKFRRLSVVYARNAAGKSTLVQVLASAASGDTARVLAYQTLDANQAPEVTLELDAGLCRFDGTGWTEPRPRVLVFDRDFIEANVYVGRRTSKSQRKKLLQIALGAEDVAYAKEMDALSRRGTELSRQLRPHTSTIKTAAEDFSLPVQEFRDLGPLEEPGAALKAAREVETQAVRSGEILKRPRPQLLPAPPSLDPAGLVRLLDQHVARIRDESAARVAAHLADRLHGRGEQWVRTGLAHADDKTCPFCAQSVGGVELVHDSAAWFDDAYDAFVEQLDLGLARLDEVRTWWDGVGRVGRANIACFEAWNDVLGSERPDLDSRTRQRELRELDGQLRQALAARRQQPLAKGDAGELTPAVRLWAPVMRAIESYNEGIRAALSAIEERARRVASLSVEEARIQVRTLEARIRRHSPEIRKAITAEGTLRQRKREIEDAKKEAAARLREGTQARLGQFVERVNSLLEDLGAEFRIETLSAERGGGAAGARFRVAIDCGSLDVANSAGEERFQRLLSDGDRTTLALAVFLSSLDKTEDLTGSIIVFDDPMTSLDVHRSEATAEQITRLVPRCKQVLVLSHHPPFLAQVVHDWNRHGRQADGSPGPDLVELELERGSGRLQGWSAAEHFESEYQRRLRTIQEFASNPSLDSRAPEVWGDIRKLLEGDIRHRRPGLFDSAAQPLEPVLRKLRTQPELLDHTPWSEDDLQLLERLCAFGARGNHDGSGHAVGPPAPEEVRRQAKRALAFVRQ